MFTYKAAKVKKERFISWLGDNVEDLEVVLYVKIYVLYWI